MAIVRHLIELHGGTIAVSSAGKGQGATFVVTLPVRVPAAADLPHVEQRAVSRDVTAESTVSLDGVSVLIVDDEADAREILALLLQERGAEVTAVSSAPAALRVLKRRVPDVLVSDVGMPGMDGHALIRRLRTLPESEGGQVPAVAVTAYATATDNARALAAGFTRHVSKPIVPSEIVEIIATLATPRRSPDVTA
jgi:CheY-like chemotaxis protein